MVTAIPTGTLDLVVERYEFSATRIYNKYAFLTEREAILRAATLAESILYNDIYGALQLDMVTGWGKGNVDYPKHREQGDDVAKWQSNWHIPPHEYEQGIRWKPLDGMQQFDVKIEA